MKSFCHFCFLQVVTTPARSLTLNLDWKENNETHLRKLGKLNVCVNESLGSKTIMEIVFRCSELENKDLFSKSVSICLFMKNSRRNLYEIYWLFFYWLSKDPFLLMSRKEESGVLVPISKTEVKKNDRNPIWRPVIVNLQQIVSKVCVPSSSSSYHVTLCSLIWLRLLQENPLAIECFNFNSNGKHELIG